MPKQLNRRKLLLSKWWNQKQVKRSGTHCKTLIRRIALIIAHLPRIIEVAMSFRREKRFLKKNSKLILLRIALLMRISIRSARRFSIWRVLHLNKAVISWMLQHAHFLKTRRRSPTRDTRKSSCQPPNTRMSLHKGKSKPCQNGLNVLSLNRKSLNWMQFKLKSTKLLSKRLRTCWSVHLLVLVRPTLPCWQCCKSSADILMLEVKSISQSSRLCTWHQWKHSSLKWCSLSLRD